MLDYQVEVNVPLNNNNCLQDFEDFEARNCKRKKIIGHIN